MRQENSRLNAEIEILQEEVINWKNTNGGDISPEEISKYQDKIDELEDQIRAQTFQNLENVNQLENEISEQQSMNADLSEKVQEWRLKADNYANEIKTIKQENKSLHSENKKLNETIEELQNSEQNLKEECEGYKQEISKMWDQISEKKQLEIECEKLKNDLSKCQSELEQSQNTIQELEKQIAECQNENVRFDFFVLFFV